MDAIVQYVLCGIAGSAVKSVLESNGNVMMPHKIRNENGDVIGWNVGFLGNFVVGVSTALVVDHSPYVSFFSAISGAYIIEQLSKKVALIVVGEKK